MKLHSAYFFSLPEELFFSFIQYNHVNFLQYKSVSYPDPLWFLPPDQPSFLLRSSSSPEIQAVKQVTPYEGRLLLCRHGDDV